MLNGLLLRLDQKLYILGKRLRDLGPCLSPDQFPGRVENLLLQLGELLGLLFRRTLSLLLLLLLLLVGGRLVSLAEDLFEVSYLGKEHVRHRAARLSGRVDVIGEEVVRDKVVRFGLCQFQFNKVSQFVFLATLCGCAERNGLWFLIADRHDEAMILHAEIIPHGRFEFDFFNRRNLQVFRRENKF